MNDGIATYLRRLWHRRILQYLLIAPVALKYRRSRDVGRETILANQSLRLRRLIEAAVTHTPYYRELLDETGLRADVVSRLENFHQFPFLQRVDLQDFYHLLIAANRWLRWCGLQSTSGTTGRPLLIPKPWEVVLEEYHSMEWRYDLMGLQRSRLRPFSTGYLYVSDTEYNADLRTYAMRLPALRLTTFRKIDVRSDDPHTCRRLLRDIHRWRPVILNGKPSSLRRLLQISRRHDPNRDFPPMAKAIVTGAEQLLPDARAELESGFGVRVFDQYGLTETGVIGIECPQHDGLHYRDDHYLVEIIRDDERVTPGDSGEIVVTDLNNRMLPLIRYRTGDVGSVTYEACPCGSPYPRIRLIEGRLIDLFQTREGKTFNPFVLLGQLPQLGLHQYQIIQTALDHLEVRYIGDSASQDVANAVRPEVTTHMGGNVAITALAVDSLDVPGRKTRLFLNRMNAPESSGAGEPVE